MGLFSRPKRAKAVAKPRSAKEAIDVKEGLERLYPVMMLDPYWSKPKKGTK